MFLRRLLCLWVTISFVSSLLIPPQKLYAQSVLDLPAPGTMVSLSPSFEPALIRGLTVHQDNPFLFDFIVDPGQDLRGVIARSEATKQSLKAQADRMIKYFFAALTIPDKDIWVNLSPYEKDRMIPVSLGQTAMGRDLLAQDYMLKQLTASLIYPQNALGKTFWKKVYSKAKEMYGTTQIPVNTFNKVWIVPQRAGVYEHGQTAFIVSGHLKVMLEEDYLSLTKHNAISNPSGVIARSAAQRSPQGDEAISERTTNNTHSLGSQIIRQIILPEIEKEINEGKNFATLRQIFYAQVLAVWFKRNLKQALLNQVYANKSTVKGIDQNDSATNEAIYHQYLKAYKKGVFNFIQEEPADLSLRGGVADEAISKGTTIPRKYFSGGFADLAQLVINPAQLTKVDIDSAQRAVDFAVLAVRPSFAKRLLNKGLAAVAATGLVLSTPSAVHAKVQQQAGLALAGIAVSGPAAFSAQGEYSFNAPLIYFDSQSKVRDMIRLLAENKIITIKQRKSIETSINRFPGGWIIIGDAEAVEPMTGYINGKDFPDGGHQVTLSGLTTYIQDRMNGLARKLNIPPQTLIILQNSIRKHVNDVYTAIEFTLTKDGSIVNLKSSGFTLSNGYVYTEHNTSTYFSPYTLEGYRYIRTNHNWYEQKGGKEAFDQNSPTLVFTNRVPSKFVKQAKKLLPNAAMKATRREAMALFVAGGVTSLISRAIGKKLVNFVQDISEPGFKPENQMADDWMKSKIHPRTHLISSFEGLPDKDPSDGVTWMYNQSQAIDAFLAVGDIEHAEELAQAILHLKMNNKAWYAAYTTQTGEVATKLDEQQLSWVGFNMAIGHAFLNLLEKTKKSQLAEQLLNASLGLSEWLNDYYHDRGLYGYVSGGEKKDVVWTEYNERAFGFLYQLYRQLGDVKHPYRDKIINATISFDREELRIRADKIINWIQTKMRVGDHYEYGYKDINGEEFIPVDFENYPPGDSKFYSRDMWAYPQYLAPIMASIAGLDPRQFSGGLDWVLKHQSQVNINVNGRIVSVSGIPRWIGTSSLWGKGMSELAVALLLAGKVEEAGKLLETLRLIQTPGGGMPEAVGNPRYKGVWPIDFNYPAIEATSPFIILVGKYGPNFIANNLAQGNNTRVNAAMTSTNRREFLRLTGTALASTALFSNPLLADTEQEQYQKAILLINELATKSSDTSKLVKMGKSAIPALLNELNNPDRTNIRGYILEALNKIGDPDVIPAIIETMAHVDYPYMKGEVLSGFPVEAVRPPLINRLKLSQNYGEIENLTAELGRIALTKKDIKSAQALFEAWQGGRKEELFNAPARALAPACIRYSNDPLFGGLFVSLLRDGKTSDNEILRAVARTQPLDPKVLQTVVMEAKSFELERFSGLSNERDLTRIVSGMSNQIAKQYVMLAYLLDSQNQDYGFRGGFLSDVAEDTLVKNNAAQEWVQKSFNDSRINGLISAMDSWSQDDVRHYLPVLVNTYTGSRTDGSGGSWAASRFSVLINQLKTAELARRSDRVKRAIRDGLVPLHKTWSDGEYKALGSIQIPEVYYEGKMLNKDSAMTDHAMTHGGIDLSQQDAALHVTKDANGGVKVSVDPALIARIEREGMPEVVPIIINMQPADIRSLFGIKDTNY